MISQYQAFAMVLIMYNQDWQHARQPQHTIGQGMHGPHPVVRSYSFDSKQCCCFDMLLSGNFVCTRELHTHIQPAGLHWQ